MVLFHEEKKEEVRPPAPRIRMFLWIIMGFVILFGLGVLFLTALGGTHDSLKKGLEEYMTGAYGMKARIDNFDYMGFVPDMRIDLRNIRLTAPGESEASVTVGSAGISRRFQDQLLGRRQMERFHIANLRFAPGYLTVRGAEFQQVEFVKEGPSGTPAFVINGKYGDDVFEGYIEIARNAAGQYRRPEKSSFSFTSPFLKAEGEILDSREGMKIALRSVGTPEKIMEGFIVLKEGHAAGAFTSENQEKAAGEIVKALCFLVSPARAQAMIEKARDVTINGAPLSALIRPGDLSCQNAP